MKIKLFALILTLLLYTTCLFLSSCAKIQDNKNNSENTQEQNHRDETPKDKLVRTGGEFSLTSYDEYLSHIKTYEIGDEFITFDQLSAFGTFRGLNLIYVRDKKSPYVYTYFLNDSRDNLIGIVITDADSYRKSYEEYSKNNIAKNDFNFINRSDIRSLSKELSEHYVYDGFIYYYSSGKLCEIEFEFDNISFTLYPSFGNFSNKKEILLDPPLSKLLNLDTAKEGRDEIIQLIKG